LTVLPCPTPNCEKELKALAPDTVVVVTLLTLPDDCTLVCVRPSGTIWFGAVADGGCARTSVGSNGSTVNCATPNKDTIFSRANRRSENPLPDLL
jgi:hypothetical protein